MKRSVHWIISLLILLSSLLPAEQALAQTPAEYLASIDELSTAERYQDALVLTERALDRYPRHLSLMLRHAYLQDGRGDREQAIGELLYLRDVFPNNDTVLIALGDMFLHSGYLDSAMACFEQSLKLARTKTDSFSSLVNIGGVLVYQQAFKQAISHYEQMRLQFGDSISLLNNLAQCYSHEGQSDKAIAMLEHIVQLEPGFKMPLNNLGMLYTEAGNYTAAETYFKRALAVEPGDAVVLNNYGHLLYKTKQYQPALKNINASIAKYPANAYAYRNRALVYLALQLHKEACADLRHSEELGFSMYFGNEVLELIQTHCTQ